MKLREEKNEEKATAKTEKEAQEERGFIIEETTTDPLNDQGEPERFFNSSLYDEVDFPDTDEEDDIQEPPPPPHERAEEPANDPSEADPRHNKKLREVYAEAEVIQIDYLLSMGLAFWQKVDRDSIKMTTDEKAALQAATEARIQAHGYALSPMQMYFATLATLGAGMYIRATEVKERERKTKARKEVFETVQNQHNPDIPPETVAEAKEQLKNIKKEVLRNDFRIDKDGFYNRSPEGTYLKARQRTEKAPPEILDIINQGKEAGLGDGTINEQIRLFLYGSKDPQKNG